jgi:hypothetical protein
MNVTKLFFRNLLTKFFTFDLLIWSKLGTISQNVSLSCINFIRGVFIAAQCSATFLRSIVLPEFRYYDVNMPIKFCS